MNAAEWEEQTILAALEALDGPPEPAGESLDESAETIGRLYVEVVGLLAYQLAPSAPPPELKQRLMTTVVGDQTQEVAPLAEVAELPVRSELPVAGVGAAASVGTETDEPVTPPVVRSRRLPRVPRPAAKPLPQPEEYLAPTRPRAIVPPAPKAVPQRRWNRAVALLAAALIVVLLGTDVWLSRLLLDQRDTIAQLSGQLQSERRERLHRSAIAAAAVREFNELRRKFSLMTSREVLAAGLKPMGSPLPLQPGAHGVIFIAADHQHWYLAVSGLAPSAGDGCYQLWFVTADGPQSAGTFHVQSAAPVEISSAEMPAGTREVWITQEPAAGSPRPTGPQVLAGTQFQIL